MQKKIFIVEDSQEIQRCYRDILGREKVSIIQALTIEEAKICFAAHPDINIIVMDFQVPGEMEKNTISLVRTFRETFTGPMIAASSDPTYSSELVKAGCDRWTLKSQVSKIVIDLLCL